MSGMGSNNILSRAARKVVRGGLYVLRNNFLAQSAKSILRGMRYKNYYQKLESLLYIYKVNDFDLVRVGTAHDGGYIMLNDFATGGRGIAYSFGIGAEISWDADMAGRNYDVFMYDHTIDKLPKVLNGFHFFKEGIADSENPSDEQLHSLEYYLKNNNHENYKDMILKMDVEGAEWGFLSLVSPETLKKFGQIVFEFHNMNSLSGNNAERMLSSLDKINKTHRLVHLHANNCCGGISFNGKIFGSVIEATYASIDKYKFSENDGVKLPLAIDSPNICGREEISLGYWNRKIDLTKPARIKNI